MKNIFLILLMFLYPGCSSNTSLENENANVSENSDDGLESVSNSDLTGEGEGNDWEFLFDGTNTDKWTGVNSDQFPENGWIIEDSALVLAEGGNIITREKYGDFDLRFEFKLTPAANSGIKYFVTKLKSRENGNEVTNGPEYQIIDDFNNPDVKEQGDEKEKTAAVYLLYAPVNKKLLPAGQWNTGRIISKDKQVEHWLNGIKVVSYERGSQDFRSRREDTKFRNYESYGEVPEGHILLTDHHDKVYFKNIKIKRL